MNTSITKHTVHVGRAQDMSAISDSSVQLVVTSPPYPMVEMWDEVMSAQNPAIAKAIEDGDAATAFELMHLELDKVWCEVMRVLCPGGIVCINIGDATRTINGLFALHSNHSRVINFFTQNGFVNLPNIIWRKQTNAPNKFMGSGMLPAGAYVTLEHEWILIFRKGEKRAFKSVDDKFKRRLSSFFWEERNMWFSDLWDNIKGVKQKVSSLDSRDRSAAYPLEIPYRLINMYSLQGDTVLDPFVGTGTTMHAALMCGRNSVGYDVDNNFAQISIANLTALRSSQCNSILRDRLHAHKLFVEERSKNKDIKHYNSNIDMAVMTSQEREIALQSVTAIELESDNTVVAYHEPLITMNKHPKSVACKVVSPTTLEQSLF